MLSLITQRHDLELTKLSFVCSPWLLPILRLSSNTSSWQCAQAAWRSFIWCVHRSKQYPFLVLWLILRPKLFARLWNFSNPHLWIVHGSFSQGVFLTYLPETFGFSFVWGNYGGCCSACFECIHSGNAAKGSSHQQLRKIELQHVSRFIPSSWSIAKFSAKKFSSASQLHYRAAVAEPWASYLPTLPLYHNCGLAPPLTLLLSSAVAIINC